MAPASLPVPLPPPPNTQVLAALPYTPGTSALLRLQSEIYTHRARSPTSSPPHITCWSRCLIFRHFRVAQPAVRDPYAPQHLLGHLFGRLRLQHEPEVDRQVPALGLDHRDDPAGRGGGVAVDGYLM